ncbi:MAG TPA: acyl-CoA dehydrogenase family protein [Acidimicrobiales bacterium]
MDFDDSKEEAAFRQDVRAWLKVNACEREPGQLSTSHSFYDFDDIFVTEGKKWQGRLYDGGWAGITWPVEFGGRGGTFVESMIFRQEEARFDVASGLFAVGTGMAGPTIIGHGTDEQRRRYLPPMLRGEEVWCQLFSEPGAGSDLASLATRAERDGDEWVVNGQKVWSSGAHHSDLGILLARTDPDAPKHRGITFFALDMRSPGVEVRPLRQMTGGATFNEVFFTDVRVPADNVVGEVNGGWGATMTTLANERSASGGTGSFAQALELARECGVTGDAELRQRLAECFIKNEIGRYLSFRIQTALSRGMSAPETSVAKLAFAQLAKETAELTLSIEGPRGMLAGDSAPAGGYWQQQFLTAPSIRIAAGSDEIQRNIIGERVLGLPGDLRADKNVPFRDLVR